MTEDQLHRFLFGVDVDVGVDAADVVVVDGGGEAECDVEVGGARADDRGGPADFECDVNAADNDVDVAHEDRNAHHPDHHTSHPENAADDGSCKQCAAMQQQQQQQQQERVRHHPPAPARTGCSVPSTRPARIAMACMVDASRA